MNFPKTIISAFASVLLSSAFLLSGKATAQVDLVLENGSITYNSTTHELTVTVDIKNAGAGDTPPFVGFRVGCYLSTDTVVDGKDYEFTYFSMSYGMFAGEVYKQKSTGAVDLDSYTNAPSGTYYVLLKTDAQSQIIETNENNNTLKCGTITYNTVTGTISYSANTATTVKFEQIYPNPFSGITSFQFYLPESGYTTLKINDIIGKEVAVVVNEQLQSGNYKYDFEKKELPAGVYYCTLSSNSKQETRKLIIY